MGRESSFGAAALCVCKCVCVYMCGVCVCVYVWGVCMHIKVHMHVCTCLKAGSQCSTGSLAVICQPCIDASRTRIKFYSRVPLRCVHAFGGKIFTRKALYS